MAMHRQEFPPMRLMISPLEDYDQHLLLAQLTDIERMVSCDRPRFKILVHAPEWWAHEPSIEVGVLINGVVSINGRGKAWEVVGYTPREERRKHVWLDAFEHFRGTIDFATKLSEIRSVPPRG